jgi:hypothetical protein
MLHVNGRRTPEFTGREGRRSMGVPLAEACAWHKLFQHDFVSPFENILNRLQAE